MPAPRFHRLLPVTAAAAAAGAVAACLLTPRPAALLIRAVFHRGAQELVRQMRPYAPAVSEHRGLAYTSDGGTRRLDLFLPAGHSARTGKKVPVILWVHGGAWISGTRHDVAPYLRMLAARGYAAVGVDYSVAPGSRYPRALRDVDDAASFLQEAASRYGLDMDQVILAGDSAGAQLAAQLAAAVASPGYAAALGFSPALSRQQLRAAVLHCGVYDLRAMGRLTGVPGWGFRTALWAYIGKRRFSGSAAAEQMSVISHASPAFPPTYISGGNGDGLTLQQSMPFADRLQDLGVPVTRKFWPAALSPALPHEAQFQFSRPEARAVVDETAAFLAAVLSGRDAAPAKIPAGIPEAPAVAGSLRSAAKQPA
ncbi:alpha/beta hydrolase [Arthrobacter gandavensis]|uniref:alpha/beta hydrolase n=1 Tax=Arthrobacter gandavensis TaxID=169960 RepID=UPI00188E5636|nr:alpha/beta hydrolase [Arthrobacter gandavensis]MBF4993188.1 alpha/beta hydrolase [Arthrobacter gandavensis]